ncbi:MAG: phosphatidylglycerol lysyltransferase [Sulfitobacter sp.]|jgi:phosphatidylglycerol lysyltransferase
MTTAEPIPRQSRVTRILEHPIVKILVPLVIVGIAFMVMHKLALRVSWTDVKADIASSTWRMLALAVLWTSFSFVALSFYDVLAVRSVAKGQVPARVAGFAGASGYAVSNLLGFSYLTGTAVRYRVYASLGLDISRVAGVIATSWIAFWLGLILILGVLFSLHPNGLSSVLPLDNRTETMIGAGLLLLLAGLFIWLSRGKKRLTLVGFGFDLPDFKLAIALTVVAVFDVMGAAMTMYVLLPADLIQSYPYFFTIYIGAIALGILSHAPGGLGVFEATLIAGLGAAGRSDVLAALLLYRLIYTLLPFLVACIGLAIGWSVTRKQAIKGSASLAYRLVRPIVPMAAAGVSLLAGAILVISGNLPADTARLGVLREILPLPFVEASHLAGSVAGLLLIVISRGLYRKLYRAWLIAMAMMAVGLAASILKGLDWEEAISLIASIAVLGAFKGAFYRVEGASVFRLNTTWIVSVLALFAAIFWIGLFAYSHVEYRDALWWDFAWHGDASRFLRSMLVAALILAGIALNSVLNFNAKPAKIVPIPDVVRQLVRDSEDTEANISLTGDKHFLVSEDGRAFLAYGDTGTSLISKGEPVGAEDAGRQLLWQLREKADKAGKRCAFYAVSPKYVPTFLDLGFSILKIGEVARVNLQGFTLEGSAKKDFRQARNRAARDGYSFEVIAKENLGTVLPELRDISDRWLASKQGEEKGFALGGFEENYVSNFDHAVLKENETGRIVAFANLFQGAAKHELSLDLMRYDPQGPNFAMDALFAELMLWGAAQGYHWFSLGAAPFSGLENHQLTSLWNRMGSLLYAHGEHLYHFEGLRTFKQKFDPTWTPNYLAGPGGMAVPRILYEVNVLISGGIRGLMK